MFNRLFFVLTSLLLIGSIACNSGEPKEEGGSNSSNDLPKVSLPGRNAEATIIMLLRNITTAELNYMQTSGQYATLEELVDKNLIDSSFAGGERSGYRFQVEPKSGTSGFEATAIPVKYGVTGKSSFYVDESGVIRSADKEGEKATSDDPQVQ
jgi:hypothetical protein